VEDKRTGQERTAIHGFKGTPVFGLGQTEGEATPAGRGEVEEWLDSLPLRHVAEEWGISVGAYDGRGANYLGQYRHASGIALGVRNHSTWCHELVHAADDRNGSLKKKGGKVDLEVVAELGGAVLLTMLGQTSEADLGGCWEYIQRLAGPVQADVLSVCGKVLDRTCEAVALILDTAETALGTGSPWRWVVARDADFPG
jgi:hypothetical protein